MQGLEPLWEYGGQRRIRLASLYPETIDSVDFYCLDELIYTAYDEPFSVCFHSNWRQDGWNVRPEDREWRAVVHLRDGSVLTRTVEVWATRTMFGSQKWPNRRPPLYF